MKISLDEWTPFFDELSDKLNPQGRKQLLFKLIGDVYDTTVLNFGYAGEHRPSDWKSLSNRYAFEYHDGDRTPTLVLSGALKNGFVHEATDTYATLTNQVDYADIHQFGDPTHNIPARPYYPVDESGMTFTTYQESRLREILEEHFKS